MPPGPESIGPSTPVITGQLGITNSAPLISIPSLAPGTVPLASCWFFMSGGSISEILLLIGMPQFASAFSLFSCLN